MDRTSNSHVPTIIQCRRIINALKEGGTMLKTNIKLSTGVNGKIYDKTMAWLISEHIVEVYKTKSEGLHIYRLNPCLERD